jgi:long-chain acyl-CoA synthetase
VQTDTAARSGHEAAYDARPWLDHYAEGVPHSVKYPRQTVWQLLEETVATYGGRTAFVFQGSGMTFSQLKAQAERLSAALAAAGVQQGDVVLAVLPNTPHFPVLYHAILRLGAILAAAPPNSVEREIENLLEDSGARVIVTLDLLFDKVSGLCGHENVGAVVVGTAVDFMPARVRALGKLLGKVPRPKEPVAYGGKVRPLHRFMRTGKPVPPARVDPDDIAVLQYTGGTTGTPKAAMLTHYSLLSNAQMMRSWFPTLRQGEETLLAALPFFHVYGVTLAMNAGLLLAARIILIPRAVVADMLEAIGKYRPTIFPGVPTLYVAVTNDPRSREYDLSSIDICVSGGAPLPYELKRDFEKMTGGHLYEGYGLSEASPCTHCEPCDGRHKVGSMGFPMPDTECRVIDEEGRAVPLGEEGELAIRGPQVMRGYWRRAEETADVLSPDGWLRTGDIARMDDEGWFYLVDRKKDLIITGGENIYPREVEDVLFEHPAVKEAAVVGVPHPFGGEVAKAFIVLKPGASATKKDITQFAGQRLAKHKVPRAVEFRTELPKSAAQKVLRRVLAEEERARQAKKPLRRRRERAVAEDGGEDGA